MRIVLIEFHAFVLNVKSIQGNSISSHLEFTVSTWLCWSPIQFQRFSTVAQIRRFICFILSSLIVFFFPLFCSLWYLFTHFIFQLTNVSVSSRCGTHSYVCLARRSLQGAVRLKFSNIPRWFLINSLVFQVKFVRLRNVHIRIRFAINSVIPQLRALLS